MAVDTLAQKRETVQTLFSYLEQQGRSDYLGEHLSQLEHSLQTAALAVKAGADEQTVIAALLHDVGRFIPAAKKLPKMIATDGTYIGTESHERVGEKYLRDLGFPPKVCEIVGAHVWAKRYLCATEATYWDSLSVTSKRTLEYQGGRFTPAQVEEARKDPLLQEKLDVRRWDDLAKVPGLNVPGLDAYEGMAVRLLSEGIELHGRTYALPRRPTVVICVDGFDPEYLEHGIADGILPTLKEFVNSGFHVTADVAMPTFTNPNNVSIITGMPTAVHGIAGNYFLDRETGEETMIVDASLLRGSTILAELASRGVRVAAITAKDKLRQILAYGLDKGSRAICYSAELADEETQKWLGRDRPSRYSGELSLFVLDAGLKLLREEQADLFYLTLSDYVQHKHAPGDKESNAFMAAMDARVKQFVELGAVVSLTGDHGMSDKSNEEGRPNLVLLQDELENKFGAGCARVICPITDPFVKHHGALGSFVRVYVNRGFERQTAEMIEYCKALPLVEASLSGTEAAELYEMPLDREGDFVVVAVENAVLGSTAAEHELGNLDGHRLRSHGGLFEQAVPLLMSRPAEGMEDMKAGRRWRNFDIFDLVLNHGQE